MRTWIFIPFTLIIAIPAFCQSRIDTIYYTQQWGICEKPFATYYRLGEIAIDTFWYFKGPVKDFYLDGTLQMEGSYNSLGYKHGTFNFYYPNGVRSAKGEFADNKMIGHWIFFYPNGNEKADIYFSGSDFIFFKQVDTNGVTIIDSATGKFIWPINETAYTYSYILEGKFFKGNREGSWKFHSNSSFREGEVLFEEQYEKGKFKKGKSFSLFNSGKYDSQFANINLLPYKFQATEHFLTDNSVRSYLDEETLSAYLINHKAPVFNNTSSDFVGSVSYMIKTLTQFKAWFNYEETNYNGKVDFLLDEDGFPKDVSVVGNLTDKESEILIFLVSKFRNLKMPANDKISVEAYHTIYFFTLDTKDMLKKSDKQFGRKEFLFSVYPLEEVKKSILLKNQY